MRNVRKKSREKDYDLRQLSSCATHCFLLGTTAARCTTTSVAIEQH